MAQATPVPDQPSGAPQAPTDDAGQLAAALTQYVDTLNTDEKRAAFAEGNEWARHYNGLIWQIGSILIPLSLGGLTLNFHDEKTDELNRLQLLTVAAGSFLLLSLWFLLSEALRSYRIYVTSLTDYILTENRQILVVSNQGIERARHTLITPFVPLCPKLWDRKPPSHFGFQSTNPDRGLRIRYLIYLSILLLWSTRLVLELELFAWIAR